LWGMGGVGAAAGVQAQSAVALARGAVRAGVAGGAEEER